MDNKLAESLTEAASETRHAARLRGSQTEDRLQEMLDDMTDLAADVESACKTFLAGGVNAMSDARRLEASRMTMAIWRQNPQLLGMADETATVADALLETAAIIRNHDVPNVGNDDAEAMSCVAKELMSLSARAKVMADALRECRCLRDVDRRPPLWKAKDLVMGGGRMGRVRAATIVSMAATPVRQALANMDRAMAEPIPDNDDIDLMEIATRLEAASLELRHGPYDELCRMMQTRFPEGPRVARTGDGRVTRVCRLSARRPADDATHVLMETADSVVVAVDERDERRLANATHVSDQAIEDTIDDILDHADPRQVTRASFDEMVSADMDGLSIQGEYKIGFPKRGILETIRNRDEPHGHVTYDVVSERIDGCETAIVLPREGCVLPDVQKGTVAVMRTSLPHRTNGTYELDAATLETVAEILGDPEQRLRRLRRVLDALPQTTYDICQ